jgi:hypothetical protein
MCSSGFRCRNFRVTMNFDRSTKLRLTTTHAIATYTLLSVVVHLFRPFTDNEH